MTYSALQPLGKPIRFRSINRALMLAKMPTLSPVVNHANTRRLFSRPKPSLYLGHDRVAPLSGHSDFDLRQGRSAPTKSTLQALLSVPFGGEAARKEES
jgi:hypothetical protein